MNARHFANRYRSVLSVGLIVLLAVGITGCATTEEQRRTDLQQDIGTCASFGAHYGSPQHTQCMLFQQQRRDAESLEALERARIASEISKNTQEMIDRRKQRSN